MSNTVHSYKELIVWQRAMDLVTEIYTLTDGFPKEELYGLTSQMRRAAVSVPSNIAEGRCRGHLKEYKQFLWNAYGSGAELETQIEISKRLYRSKNLNYAKVDSFLEEVMKMLNVIINKLRVT